MILCPTRILRFFTPDTISNDILYSIPQYVDLIVILHVEGIQLTNIPFLLYKIFYIFSLQFQFRGQT